MPLTPPHARYLEIRIGVSRRPARARPDGTTPVPETVTLRRWRALTSAKCSYHGCRLPPSLWRLVRAMLTHDPRLGDASRERVQEVMSAVRLEAKVADRYLGSVPADAFLMMFRFLARGRRLERILAAHAGDTRFGVPDLLLFRIKSCRAMDFRFVEVKRHDELVRDDQVVELELLKRLRLTAGILRLEKPRTTAPPTARRRMRL